MATTHTSSLQIGRCKLPEGYSTLTQVCCTNGVFTTVWRFSDVKYGTMSTFKIKMGRGLRTIGIIGHFRLLLAPQMTDPPSFAHLLPACRHSMAGGLGLNIWWKRGACPQLAFGCQNQNPKMNSMILFALFGQPWVQSDIIPSPCSYQ